MFSNRIEIGYGGNCLLFDVVIDEYPTTSTTFCIMIIFASHLTHEYLEETVISDFNKFLKKNRSGIVDIGHDNILNMLMLICQRYTTPVVIYDLEHSDGDDT